MGFISTPTDPVTPPGTTVAGDAWYPPIDCSTIRERVRIGEGMVTHQRLVWAVENAIATASDALADWRAAREAEGAGQLSEVAPTSHINGRTRAAFNWERIVTHYAAAEIADLHRDITASNEAGLRGEEDQLTADDHRRLAHAAVADMLSLGVPAAERVTRNQIELL